MFDTFDTQIHPEEMTEYEEWECFASWIEEEEYERD